MFVGHYAVSFYLKSRDPDIPLWVLFVAVQLVDIMWALLSLAGVEHFLVVPGITAASPLDLQYVPYTHSLPAAVGWSLLALWIWFRVRPGASGRMRAAGFVGLAVFSHWVADFLVHRPDLPLYDNSHKVGLGLWNYPAISYPLEVGLLGVTMWLWYRASNGGAGKRTLVILWLVLTGTQAFTNFGSLPSTPSHFAVLALSLYLVFAFASRAGDAAPSSVAA
jgi:hypothetical protein